MSQTPDASTVMDLPPLVGHIDKELTASFDQRFDLWLPPRFWVQTFFHDEPTPLSRRRSRPLSAIDPSIAELIESRRQPCVLPVDEQRVLLAIPVYFGDVLQLVATGEFAQTESSALVGCAKIFLSGLSKQAELKRLRQENENFALQLVENYEERSFLRSLAVQLEMSSSSVELTELATAVLPVLHQSIKAESLALLIATHESEPEPAEEFAANKVCWSGPAALDPPQLRQVVELFGQAAQQQPVVRNHLTEKAGSPLPGVVRDLILAPVNKQGRLLGWILAVNRTPPAEVALTGNFGSQTEFGTDEASLLRSAASILATHAYYSEVVQEKDALLTSLIRAIVGAVESQDEYRQGHSRRVAAYAVRLAIELGESAEACDRIELAGLLHDVGKLRTQNDVWNKPGELSDSERAHLRTHAEQGVDILRNLVPMAAVLPGVLHHHEHVDGGGYPSGLRGDEIPLDGRILAIADAYDALTHARPHRPAYSQARAEQILLDGAGAQWDAALVEVFLRIMPAIAHLTAASNALAAPAQPSCP